MKDICPDLHILLIPIQTHAPKFKIQQTNLDNNAAAANNLSCLAFFVQFAEARPFSQFLGVVNLPT